MRGSTRTTLFVLPFAALLFLALFFAFPGSASAAEPEEIRYSPLFEASLQNTIREFAEKESGSYETSQNGAVTETAETADVGDADAAPEKAMAYTIPGVPNIPSVPSYTSSYSCGTTCGATCGSTCTSTCTYTCGATCGATCTTTCTSTCAGTSTCIGSSTCVGGATCVGSSTCVGTASCNSATCFGYSTCSGASTCNGTSTCTFGGVCVAPLPGSTSPPGGTTTPPTSTPLPETPSGTTPSSWALSEVNEAIKLNFVPADLQKNYQSSITRKEFCTLVIQFIREIVESVPGYDGLMDTDLGPSPFTDVDDRSVTWAYHLDIVSGVGNGKFNPDGKLSRQEAAKMLTNMAVELFDFEIGTGAASFTDGGQIADWAVPSVNFVSKHGIMSGMGDGKFAPLGAYTREQSFITVLRAYKSLLLGE